MGVTTAGERDILGLWAGTGGEGAKFWMSVPTDLRNRGVKDTFFVGCFLNYAHSFRYFFHTHIARGRYVHKYALCAIN